jgi:predicted NAD/FAD-binding protein
MLMLTYRINSLQELPEGTPTVMETLNRDREPAAGSVLAELTFMHPMYSRQAVAAQCKLPGIQGVDRIWYAGAWTRYGFHEDGMLSGVRASEALGAALPWGQELDSTRTRVRVGAPVPMLGQTRKLYDTEFPPVADEPAPRQGVGPLRREQEQLG